jgi:hypothetical protein
LLFCRSSASHTTLSLFMATSPTAPAAESEDFEFQVNGALM